MNKEDRLFCIRFAIYLLITATFNVGAYFASFYHPASPIFMMLLFPAVAMDMLLGLFLIVAAVFALGSLSEYIDKKFFEDKEIEYED